MKSDTVLLPGKVVRDEPTRYFASAWEMFDRAAGSVWHDQISIGEKTVRFEGKGSTLHTALTSALEHLRISDDREGDLLVRTWDGSGGRAALPPLPSAVGDELSHDKVMRLSDENHVVVWERHFDAVTLLDRANRRAIYFTGNAASLPYYETAAPLRALWHAWFSERGALPLHGACVGRDGDALLLTAPGGNGKSTTALLGLQAGMDYLADDWCLVDPGQRKIHSLFGTAKLRPDNLHRFPHLADRIHNFDKLDEEKATFFLHRYFQTQLRASARLRAIVIPRVGGTRDCSFVRANSALAWHALIGVTLRGIPGSGRELFSLLGEVARCVPVYSLSLGSDLPQVPRALSAILDEVNGRGRDA
jgi:hypothetical protein